MNWDENDEFEIPLTQTAMAFHELDSVDKNQRPLKKPKRKTTALRGSGKENVRPSEGCEILNCSLDFIPSSLDCISVCSVQHSEQDDSDSSSASLSELKQKGNYLHNSIESKLVVPRIGELNAADADSDSELGLLMNLCDELEEVDSSVRCPLCDVDLSNLTEEQRHLHTNNCLDKGDNVAVPEDDKGAPHVPKVASVVDWLHGLGLGKYEVIFVREEVDWNTLQWLTEEDLLSMGITAFGPRKKIVHALCELRKGDAAANEKQGGSLAEPVRIRNQKVKLKRDKSERKTDGSIKPPANKLITEYFSGFASKEKKVPASPGEQKEMKKSDLDSGRKHKSKNVTTNRKLRDVPKWCSVQGTPFRVDAFKYLRGDCSHWFLTHFHLDHYQGLTKSFNHGKIYCSSITARLVNTNIGISYDKLHVLPLNQKIEIAGVDVTCFDANHCPGSILVLFQPPNGKAVLHTGDFRFSDEMTINPLLKMCPIDTLILDTTYCNPQYDFPKQEAVIQFVIDAIQAETFNPKTLFLIGSYTIGKERIFLEVARALSKKVHVTAAKLRLLKCLEFKEEDMQWFTSNEHESNIHVAPMWTLASFKRLKHISSQYKDRYNLIVAFSPTGWTFGKGKKKSPGRRWQQGTIIRYEVPYSEHSSFTELKEFVKLVSHSNIIPSVNNDGPESSDAMISLLLS
ncbi:DNA cross-link repair protein SNM1 isoform X1 [Vigna umbellata]|uniref:DNA cross-link repair protein SNM1 isoform X1 n=1 Tax=Vigna umbellata TaxID=87088 RepID=UPI001F5EE138|nr:DNA cross-link repair protein SNM1 isoform X1 [Vigna umbellata]